MSYIGWLQIDGLDWCPCVACQDCADAERQLAAKQVPPQARRVERVVLELGQHPAEHPADRKPE